MIVIVASSEYPDAITGAIRYVTFAHTYIDMGFEVVLLNKSSDSFCHSVRAESIAKGNKYMRLLFGYNAIKTFKRISRKMERFIIFTICGWILLVYLDYSHFAYCLV